MSISLDSLHIGLGKRFPVIRQSGAAECGHACLAMISSFFGHEISLLEMRKIQDPSLRGMSLQSLMQLAGKVQLNARPVKVELEHLLEATDPVILHWQFNHFVVLVKANKKELVIADPARGLVTVSMEEASRCFTGVAVEITPSEAFVQRKSSVRLTLGHLIGTVRGFWGAMSGILVVALVLEALSLLGPLLGQVITDHVLVTQDQPLLTFVVAAFMAAAAMRVFFAFSRDWLVVALSAGIRLQVASRLVRHVMRLPPGFFEQRRSIDIQSRLDSLDEIERVMATTFLQAMLDSFMALATLAIVYYYSASLGVMATVALVIYAAFRLATFQPLRRLRLQAVENHVRQSSHMVESLRSIVPIKLALRTDWRFAQWHNLAAATANSQIEVSKLELYIRTASAALTGLTSVAFIGLAAKEVMDGNLTVGGLLAVSAYYGLISTRLFALVDATQQLRLLAVHLDRLADFVYTEQEKVSGPGVGACDAGASSVKIELRNVGFRYSESDPWLFRGVNLTVEQGENVCIIGPSGSGKSTLLKIISGVVEPNEGEVLVNGRLLADFGHNRLRELMSVVLQDDRVYFGSIGENISFFDSDSSPEQVAKAASDAALLQEIAGMPMGFETLVGEDGAGLSGGQIQRIFIARALYRKPKLLLLDEATSNLDVATERVVNDSVKRLQATRIFVAHRPETIASADRTFSMPSA